MSETKERETVPCAYCPWDCAYKGDIKKTMNSRYYARCNSNSSDCDHTTDVFDTEDEAIDAWNEEMLGMWSRRAALAEKCPAPAWVTEVPTEEGYYLAVSKFPGTRELHDKTPMTIRVYRYGDTLYVKSHGVITLASYVRMWCLVYFRKINVPAVPRKGGNK